MSIISLKMPLKTLGYSQKWLKFGLLDEEFLKFQYIEFQKSEDTNTEHYRYASFTNWMSSKTTFTDLEVAHFFDLATDDPDAFMAGAAVIALFTSSKITDTQFDWLKAKLPFFGEWTTKLIQKAELSKKLDKGELDEIVFKQCLEHSKKYSENELLRRVIETTVNHDFLVELTGNSYGKKVRNLANVRLKSLRMEDENAGKGIL